MRGWSSTLRVLAAILVVVLASGCAATTTVAVRVRRDGSGTVAVTVSLDAAANAAAGGLAKTLDTAGLAAAGWRVSGPRTSGGTTQVTATHAFTSLDQLPAVLAGVASSAGHTLFHLEVTTSRSFWSSATALAGTVDLRCGIDCFGDAGLQRTFGSTVGVNPAALERQYDETPAQALRFALAVSLPGRVTSTNAASRAGGVLHWTPTLGGELTLRARTSIPDRAHVTDVVGAGAGLAVVAVAVAAALMVTRRRRRRGGGLAGGVGGRSPAPAHSRR